MNGRSGIYERAAVLCKRQGAKVAFCQVISGSLAADHNRMRRIEQYSVSTAELLNLHSWCCGRRHQLDGETPVTELITPCPKVNRGNSRPRYWLVAQDAVISGYILTWNVCDSRSWSRLILFGPWPSMTTVGALPKYSFAAWKTTEDWWSPLTSSSQQIRLLQPAKEHGQLIATCPRIITIVGAW